MSPYRQRPPPEKPDSIWKNIMQKFMFTVGAVSLVSFLAFFSFHAFKACEADIQADKEVEMQRLKIELEQSKRSENGGCRDAIITMTAGKTAACPHPQQRITGYSSWSGRYTCSCQAPKEKPNPKKGADK